MHAIQFVHIGDIFTFDEIRCLTNSFQCAAREVPSGEDGSWTFYGGAGGRELPSGWL